MYVSLKFFLTDSDQEALFKSNITSFPENGEINFYYFWCDSLSIKKNPCSQKPLIQIHFYVRIQKCFGNLNLEIATLSP